MSRPKIAVILLAVISLAIVTAWLLVYFVLRGASPNKPGATGQVVRANVASQGERGVTALVARNSTDVALLPSLEPHQYRVHLIDVGTGLSVLVQARDFNLLYDGGSRDDKRGLGKESSRSRLLAYLYAALGASGPDKCRPEGDQATTSSTRNTTIDHLFLSHPHEDHGNYLDEVLFCYAVKNVWDVGVVNEAKFYKQFLSAVAAEPEVQYHTATTPSASGYVMLGKTQVVQIPTSIWTQFEEGQQVELDSQASFHVLSANTSDKDDFNQNSIVLRLQLGETSLLLTGDAESGERKPPSAPVGDTEARLIQKHAERINVDILQVGHHGSKTSSRRAFLDAVSPTWALISAGPKRYRGGVRLPDVEVVQALEQSGATVLRTDEHDEDLCPELDRIGVDDERPGGCDNYVLEIR